MMDSKRILILGGKGMLGQMVERVLSKSVGIDVKYTCREKEPIYFYFNVEDGLDKLLQIIERYGKFDYFINCIGVLNSRIEETDAKSVHRAILINSLFPHEIATLAQGLGARVIHISTDGVFAKNAGVCLENSPLNCDDIYGKTKSLGEVIAPGFLNLRCSIIGPDSIKNQGLLEWFLNHAPRADVDGYLDHMWNGVTTLQLAKLCRQLIIQELFDAVRHEAPVHHFCPNQAVSKYELLQLLKSAFRPDITVKPLTTGQERSVHRILDTRHTKIKELFGYGRSMQHAIAELATEMRDRNRG